MKRIAIIILAVMTAVIVKAQIVEPVHFTSQLKQTGDAEAELIFSATIDKGWHVYSTNLGSDGPTQASLQVHKMEGAELSGKLRHRGQEIKQYDSLFGMELRYFEHQGTFVQRIRLTKPRYDIDCSLEYGACSNEMCLPPTQVELKEKGSWRMPATSEATAVSAETASVDTVMADTTTQAPTTALADSTAVATDVQVQASVTSDASLWYILAMGFMGGLLALLTPCVWPIIPMTVSFFLKRNSSRSRAVREALVYGLSIVVIYLSLGLLVTLLFGASALNAMATNAFFNIFFFLLLVLFGASFLGAFELTLPASWSNRIDAKAEAMGSIFLMAFTLVLVSFSCTGPIIGFLLVAVSMEGNILAPTVGMLGFALALALPFALFALFPSWLKAAPKSGSWMNTVKVTLGFVELAFALKFLSVADLAYGWHILDREVFLSLWIVIFGLLGCYLLGWIRLPHDGDERRIGVTRLFLAMASLAFTLYMIPGLWGAPLKAISAFAPPMSTQTFKVSAGFPSGGTPSSYVEARFRDYDEGMAVAKAEGKPVMLDFTGYGCVNCRKMEAAVWTDPEVAQLLNNEYVVISLYVDDKTALPEPIEVSENGKTRTLRTVGDKWSHFQRTRFGANAQPFYVLLSNDGQQLAPSRSYDEDIAAYLDFLKKGLGK